MPERVEQESDVALSDVGPILELTYPDGRKAQIRLSSVDSAPLLKAVIGLVTDVLDPAALAGTMIDGAYAAPPTAVQETKALVDEMEQYNADGRDLLAGEANARVQAAADSVKAAAELIPQLHLKTFTEKECADSLKAQQRQHLIHISPRRRAEARVAAAAERQFSTAMLSLRCERDQAAKAAAERAAQEVRDTYDQRVVRMRAAFDTGKDWRAVK